MRKLIILLVLPLCACSVPISASTCTTADFSKRTEKVWDKFNDLESLAFDSMHDAKINLFSIVDNLRQTRDAYAQLKLASCYGTVQSSYLEYMDLTVKTWSYVVEGGEAFDSKYVDLMNAATEALNRGMEEANKLGN
jgi:hypothetical protein